MSMSSSTEPTLVLASASPRRQELISLLGLPVQIQPSRVEEDTPTQWTPIQVVEGLALRKAQAVKDQLVLEEHPNSIVVGSDTIVVLDGDVLGKPSDDDHAFEMLRRLAGRTHEVYTGVALLSVADHKSVISHRVTRVKMRTLTDEQLLRYVATGESMDKAGAYGIQELGSLLVDSIEGCYFNVVGLPISLLADLLVDFGVNRP
ncbi:MAG: Maf family protein [Candidatus Cohnella colombiensis]|uniref:dTTP/UTP pyrophosphatase n=1 Tax=Candidatus Cohnella colombiensis TaxID=3121368 RepID=A0AA95F1V6_9BACL|nr:MAG: Maf family protein [Cohnella sp.]